jgi:hypothetical protein
MYIGIPGKEDLTHHTFRLQLIAEWMTSISISCNLSMLDESIDPLFERISFFPPHYNIQKEQKHAARKYCRVCYVDTGGKRIKQDFYCADCPTKQFLHPNGCFQKFHMDTTGKYNRHIPMKKNIKDNETQSQSISVRSNKGIVIGSVGTMIVHQREE